MTAFILILFPVIFGLVGILLLLFHSRTIRRQSRCTSQTTGKVIHVKTSSPGQADGSLRVTYYYPVFQYTVDGREYTITSPFGSGNPKLYPLHSYTTVYYDPAAPETACVKGRSSALIIGIIFLAFAVLMLLFAIFFLTKVEI